MSSYLRRYSIHKRHHCMVRYSPSLYSCLFFIVLYPQQPHPSEGSRHRADVSAAAVLGPAAVGSGRVRLSRHAADGWRPSRPSDGHRSAAIAACRAADDVFISRRLPSHRSARRRHLIDTEQLPGGVAG